MKDLKVEAHHKGVVQDCGPHCLEMEGWISQSPFERLLEINIVEAIDGQAKLTMPFLLKYAQGAGLMHGGALVSLADTALVMAIKSVLPPYTHFATINGAAKYMKPFTQGIVTAIAKLTQQQDRVISGEAALFNEQGTQVMSFSADFKVARNSEIPAVTFADQNAPGGE